MSEISVKELKEIAKLYSVITSGSKQELADTIERVRHITVYKK